LSAAWQKLPWIIFLLFIIVMAKRRAMKIHHFTSFTQQTVGKRRRCRKIHSFSSTFRDTGLRICGICLKFQNFRIWKLFLTLDAVIHFIMLHAICKTCDIYIVSDCTYLCM
jgi:hypothetical protein